MRLFVADADPITFCASEVMSFCVLRCFQLLGVSITNMYRGVIGVCNDLNYQLEWFGKSVYLIGARWNVKYFEKICQFNYTIILNVQRLEQLCRTVLTAFKITNIENPQLTSYSCLHFIDHLEFV